MIIFTSICANYLHKARTLADSVKQHMPDATFLVCLVEREVKPEFAHSTFDRIVLARDAWEGDFDRFIFKHAIVEASTAVKGQFFRYLYREYPDETQFVYLDPDTFVYSDLIEIRTLLQDRPIILCPHLLHPGNIAMELSCTMHGVYNLGFLAVNNSAEAKSFIDWWALRLSKYCYDDIPAGIFTDQRWIDLAPCFFDVHICKHHGYDFAIWSMLNCDFTCENGDYRISGEPIRFIHYSSYGPGAEYWMNEWLPKGPHPFRDLYAAYGKLHDANDADGISKTPWSYGCYQNGEAIDNRVRVGYRSCEAAVEALTQNPFSMNNAQMRRHLARYQTSENVQSITSKIRTVLKTEGVGGLLRRARRKILHR